MRRSATCGCRQAAQPVLMCPGRPARLRWLQSCPASRARPLGGGCGSSLAGRALAELGPFVRRGAVRRDGLASTLSPRWLRVFSITGRQGMEALAFARRKRSAGPFAFGLIPQDGRDDLQFPAAAVRAVLHVDVESEASAKTNLYSSYVVAQTRLSSRAQPIEGDAVGDGRRLQRPQRARLLPVGVGLGQVGLPNLLDRHAPACEHLH